MKHFTLPLAAIALAFASLSAAAWWHVPPPPAPAAGHHLLPQPTAGTRIDPPAGTPSWAERTADPQLPALPAAPAFGELPELPAPLRAPGYPDLALPGRPELPALPEPAWGERPWARDYANSLAERRAELEQYRAQIRERAAARRAALREQAEQRRLMQQRRHPHYPGYGAYPLPATAAGQPLPGCNCAPGTPAETPAARLPVAAAGQPVVANPTAADAMPRLTTTNAPKAAQID